MGDHYETLNVPRGASEAEIRRAFRRAAKQAHPDRQGGDSDKMAHINRAYATLTDQRSREEYDRTGGDPHVESLEERAIAQLRQLVSQITDNIEDGNLAEIIVQSLHHVQGTVTNGANMATHRLRKFAKLRKRLGRKGGSQSLFDCVFAEKIQKAQADLAENTEALQIVEVAIKIMADYETVMDSAQQFIVFGGSPG